MSKLIITRWNHQILTALMVNGKCRSLRLEPENEDGILGNIYVGKVKNVVKNIGAAFIDLGGGRMGFYSLSENRHHIFADPARQLSDTQPRPGDELIVQVARDAVKTKDPVLSCYLNFTGKYAVLTVGKPHIGFSAKIKDSLWKEEIREQLSGCLNGSFGIIIRTNAKEAPREAIEREVLALKARMEELLSKAGCRTCYSVLRENEPSYILSLRDTYTKNLEVIITDDPTCFEEMSRYLKENQPEDLGKLSLYRDNMLSLTKLYSLETAMEEASSRRVWLKSGGYLVIEPTEALTVVDVNTGKYSGKKNIEDTLLKINLEAAVETARQIQLRNLSGIIVVDFIDMALPEHREQLLTLLDKELSADPVKTVLVDMKKLGLVEITRKKVNKPFYEQYGNFQKSQLKAN